jgi:hypothetical protein
MFYFILQIFVLTLLWFVISKGWGSIYEIIYEIRNKKKVSKDSPEIFGNTVFFTWTIQLFVCIFLLSDAEIPETYFNTYMNIQLLFVLSSILAFANYVIKNKN